VYLPETELEEKEIQYSLGRIHITHTVLVPRISQEIPESH
jgi:hypothetical protein